MVVLVKIGNDGDCGGDDSGEDGDDGQILTVISAQRGALQGTGRTGVSGRERQASFKMQQWCYIIVVTLTMMMMMMMMIYGDNDDDDDDEFNVWQAHANADPPKNPTQESPAL